MAKIVIDARVISSSTGHYTLRLLQYLEKMDKKNKYEVIVFSKDIDFWKPTSPNFSVIATDYKYFTFAEQLGFKKQLDSLDADLVHFMMPQQPILYRGRSVTTLHDLIPFQTWNSDKNWLVYHAKRTVGYFVYHIIARKSRYILVPTKYIREQFRKFAKINPDKIIVTYESADPSDKVYDKYPVPFKQYLLYVGQQSDYKNLIRLVKSHQKLLPTHPKLGLVFVGKVNQSKSGVAQYVKDSGAKNVHFTGYISDEQRNWLFPNAAAFVFPSTMEGFGLPPLEAMINGAPVVSSNAACMPELYGDAVEYFNPFDIDEMAAAIDNVISNKKRQQELIKRGEAQVAKFSWERCARETLDIYIKALNK